MMAIAQSFLSSSLFVEPEEVVFGLICNSTWPGFSVVYYIFSAGLRVFMISSPTGSYMIGSIVYYKLLDV
jgi:hypothetical protein